MRLQLPTLDDLLDAALAGIERSRAPYHQNAWLTGACRYLLGGARDESGKAVDISYPIVGRAICDWARDCADLDEAERELWRSMGYALARGNSNELMVLRGNAERYLLERLRPEGVRRVLAARKSRGIE